MPTKISGEPPWFPALAAVMDPAPDLLDSLASDFGPHAVGMNPDAYWTALHCYVTERLMDEVFERAVDSAWLRRALWVSYATAVWCTRSWRVAWMTLDASMTAPTTAEAVAPLAADLGSTSASVNAGGKQALARLAEVLRVPAFRGALMGTAYNTGYLVVIGEAPPLGNRPPHVHLEPGYVRADPGGLLDLSYGTPVPSWLTDSRERYERLVAEQPDLFQAAVTGGSGEVDLTTLWKDGFAMGVQAWGNSLTESPQDYYEPFFRWSVVYNFGLDAISRAAIVAVATGDEQLATRALAGNLLFNASWDAFPFGVLDDTIDLPTIGNQS